MMRDMATMHIDCESCQARGPACGDCVLSVLMGEPTVGLDEPERRALEVLSDGGLLPPLRLRRAEPHQGQSRAG